MASSIEQMSRDINATTAQNLGKPQSPSQTKKLEIPKISPTIQKEAIKKLEKISDDAERSEYYRKIKAYLKNDKLRKHLGECTEPPKKGDSLEALKAQYQEMTSALKESSKRLLVMNSFDNVLRFAEIGAVQYLHQTEKLGLAAFMIEKKEELFQPELEELIIELSDDWVPSAKVRLGLKIMQVALAYDRNLLNPGVPDAKPDAAGVAKVVPKRRN